MSDPNRPQDPRDPVDPIDAAYAQAEAMLNDEAERAARRARVLAAVAAAAEATPEPLAAVAAQDAAPPPPPPARRRSVSKPAPWLMAAGVAGVATLVALRVAPPLMAPPPQQVSPPAAAPDATPLAPPPAAESASVGDVAPPPPAAPASAAKAPAPAPAPAPPRPPAAAPAAPRAEASADLAPPPPLPIPPVEHRVETPAPPIVAAAAPPPPPPPPPPPSPSMAARAAAPGMIQAPAAAMSGRAPGAPPSSGRITRPDWLRRPTADDIAANIPDRARRAGLAGRATIFCTVTATGALADCAVLSETPADNGFGEAALRLSKMFRMKAVDADGARTEGGTIVVPIDFPLPQ